MAGDSAGVADLRPAGRAGAPCRAQAGRPALRRRRAVNFWRSLRSVLTGTPTPNAIVSSSFPHPPSASHQVAVQDKALSRRGHLARGGAVHLSLASRPGTRSVSSSPTLSTNPSPSPLPPLLQPHTHTRTSPRTHPPTHHWHPLLSRPLSQPGRPMAATAVAASLSVAPRGLGGKPLCASAAASLRVPCSPRRSVVVRASAQQGQQQQQQHHAAREWAGAAAVAAALVLPEVAEAAAPGLSPSLKNFLLSIVSGGVVLFAIVGAVVAVSNFDPVKRG